MLGDAWVDLGVINLSVYGIPDFISLGNGIVLAGIRGEGRWYKSIDYGLTWTDMGVAPGGEPNIYCFTHIGNGVVVAGMGAGHSNVIRSSDWGDSFVFIKELEFWLDTCLSLTHSGNSVWAGTDGTKWTGHNTEIFRSTDAGLTWDTGKPFSASPFSSTTSLCYLGGGIIVAGTQHGEIARSTDYGATWTGNIKQIGDLNVVCDFAHLGGGVVLLCSEDGDIWRSSDYGATWAKIASLEVALYQLAYAGGDMVFVCAVSGHVYRSLNGGVSWTDLGEILTGNDKKVRSLCYLTSPTERVLLAGYSYLAGDARIARTTEAIPQLGAPTNLLCEQENNPTDVTDPQPEFSAIHHYE